MAVAKSESTPLIPIFAKTATSDAKSAESKAYIHHISYKLLRKVRLSLIVISYYYNLALAKQPAISEEMS